MLEQIHRILNTQLPKGVPQADLFELIALLGTDLIWMPGHETTDIMIEPPFGTALISDFSALRIRQLMMNLPVYPIGTVSVLGRRGIVLRILPDHPNSELVGKWLDTNPGPKNDTFFNYLYDQQAFPATTNLLMAPEPVDVPIIYSKCPKCDFHAALGQGCLNCDQLMYNVPF